MHHIVMFVYQTKKKRLFPCVSAIYIVVQKEWLATESQNAILNNFEEYHK